MATTLRFRQFVFRIFIAQFILCTVYLFTKVHRENHQLSSEFTNTSMVNEVVNTVFPDKFTIADNYTRHAVKRLALKELKGIAPLEPELGPVLNDVTSFQYSVNNQVCDRFSEQLNRTLLVIIVSAVANFEKRQMIRQTWAQTLQNSNHFGRQWARYVFLIGSSGSQHVNNESEEYGDVIQLKLAEDYSKLTLKSVALLHWVNEFCPKVHLILKCDDDIFVNVQQLASVISKISSLSSLYGSGMKGDKPNRDPGSKYFITSEEWPWAKYPAYLFGGSYLMGRDTVRHLLAAAQTTPFFTLEDVYLTGLCTVKANVNVFISQKMYRRFFPKKFDECFIRQTAMWQTQTRQQFFQSHNSTLHIYSQNVLCKTVEYTLF